MDAASKPSVLIVYYTHTQQALRVADAMSRGVSRTGLRGHARRASSSPSRAYVDRFSVFPFRHAVFDIAPLLVPQLRQKTGQIKIPEAAQDGDYDLVCFGSPTWWFRTAMPLRSYLTSAEARRGSWRRKPFAAYARAAAGTGAST